jgi:hypothetical protein
MRRSGTCPDVSARYGVRHQKGNRVTRTRWQASVALLFAFAVYSRNAWTQDPPCGDQKRCCFLPIVATTDQGQGWQPLESTLPGDWVRGIAINPAPPHKLPVAFRNEGISKSVDGGQSWHRVYEGSTRQVAFAPTDPSVVYATVLNGVLRSDDRGETWQIVPLIDDDVGISPVPPCPIYADMHRSLDGGDTWQDITLNFTDLIAGDKAYFTSWAPDPWRNVLWVGTRYNGLFFLPGSVPRDGTGSQ